MVLGLAWNSLHRINMIHITENLLMLKDNVKEFEKALANCDKEKLKNIANILVMNTDLLLLEATRYGNKG